MEEIWKDIKGYEGLYQISNLGNVRSLERLVYKSDGVIQCRKQRIMAKRKSSDGYYFAKLNVDKNSKSIAIHRLVAEAFIPNPYNLPEINHIDTDRTNNVVTNLEWCTHKDNVKHSANLGHYKHYGKNNPNYGKHTLHEVYSSNPDLAREKLARPKSQNGHARKVELYDRNHNYIKTFDWIGGCAEYLINNKYSTNTIGTLRSRINNAANRGCIYLDHYYKFVQR